MARQLPERARRARGVKDDGLFDDVLRFRTKIIAYDGNAAWVEPMLIEVAACLAKDAPPAPAADCQYCRYVYRVTRFDADMDRAEVGAGQRRRS